MELGARLVSVLLLWALQDGDWATSKALSWATQSPAPGSSFSPPPVVAVQCEDDRLVVSVNRDFFGTGRLVQAAELTLGPSACAPVPAEPLSKRVVFEVGLHECGSELQMTPDSLIYSTVLHYAPNLSQSPLVLRSSPVSVPIQCQYPRRDNVSSRGIQPTWVPFHSTLSREQRLKFSLRLMADDWSTERTSSAFQLGDLIHIQADVYTGYHVPLRLFVDSCTATLTPDPASVPYHVVIDFNGCLVDGQSRDSSSIFISPRPGQNVLRFLVDSFRFAQDSRNEIYITCHLKVTATDQAPSPLNKACSYNSTADEWLPVEGPRDICSCCQTGTCISLSSSRKRSLADQEPGNPSEFEADLMLGPLVLSEAENGPKSGQGNNVGGIPKWPELLLGLTVGIAATVCLLLGLIIGSHKFGSPCSRNV
ncbi:zona pellucida sperm-binding protein 3-like [Trichosurus vulpecula]|uniref:Zona pellucida sperm-binding protein 3 n=1 Tax=Trichosurus vulpecula TaxID=9337 RepID=O77685_TRIVU|nr:zona pellucida sperm-binding protein 3-like [Trichosurus vulpecula]AAC28736.1 zona pellucida 3 protein [Trichosurus vulpecula]